MPKMLPSALAKDPSTTESSSQVPGAGPKEKGRSMAANEVAQQAYQQSSTISGMMNSPQQGQTLGDYVAANPNLAANVSPANIDPGYNLSSSYFNPNNPQVANPIYYQPYNPSGPQQGDFNQKIYMWPNAQGNQQTNVMNQLEPFFKPGYVNRPLTPQQRQIMGIDPNDPNQYVMGPNGQVFGTLMGFNRSNTSMPAGNADQYMSMYESQAQAPQQSARDQAKNLLG